MGKTEVNNQAAVAPDLLKRVQQSVQSVIRGKEVGVNPSSRLWACSRAAIC